MAKVSQQRIVNVLGAGSLAFGLLGLARPSLLAGMLGPNGDEQVARELGFRDLGSALVLYASADKRPAIAQRMLYDVSDALLFGRAKPRVGIGALAFAALGALALTLD